MVAPALPPPIKIETNPGDLPVSSFPPLEPMLPSPDAASPPPSAEGVAQPPKKKVARAGHGVGAGGGGASTYKVKPLMWVPPPCYPYNLIPGRDLYADVIPPRPIEAQQIEGGSGWFKLPFNEGQPPGVAGPSGEHNEAKKKKKSSGKPKVPGEEGSKDGPEEEDPQRDAGVPFTGTKVQGDSDVKKKKPKSDANKAKHSESEKDAKEREKAEKAARADKSEKSGQKGKGGAATTSASKGKASTSTSKGKSVAFAANQGVRVEGARNAIREEVEEEEEPEEEVIDTRLYCICKQMYDDDRIMIACDNCDDWCHPGCVGLPEADLDLVDLFFCPACQASYGLRTTYKTACAEDGCRRPARLPLSKFCSDECGIECVMKRVDQWCMEIDPPPPQPEKALTVPFGRGRSRAKNKTPSPVVTPPPEPSAETKAALAKLEATSAVRLAKRREGLVSIESGSPTDTPGPFVSDPGRKLEEERLLSRYREALADIKTQWATKVRALAAAQARLVLLDVVVQRSEWVDFSSDGPAKCGFDSRLLMDETEWVDWKLKAREQDLRARVADIETLRTPPDTISRRPRGSLIINPHSPARTPPPVQVVVVAPSSPMQVDDHHPTITQALDAFENGTGTDGLVEPSVKPQGPGSRGASSLAPETLPTPETELSSSVAPVVAGAEPPLVLGVNATDLDMQDVEIDVLG
ncbi:hypothetical protein FRB90_003717 [Tulasnella sp. 427]|nr:hypothetical protein FRB90_003717 [Tulasnella sp. 427]